MAYKGVIFDLDGTLVDTLADLAGAMNYALAELGQPGHSLDACRLMIGNGVGTLMSRALANDKQHLRDRAVEIMLAYYNEHCTTDSSLYGGITEVVNDLAQMGLRMAVLTNKGQPEADKIINCYFDEGLFECVLGIDNSGMVKPDTKMTMMILDKMKLRADEVLLVGDSEVDVQTAGKAGMCCAGVSWGFRGRDVLVAAGADVVVNRPKEILGLIDGIW